MSYYSTMDACEFPTDKNREEILKEIKKAERNGLNVGLGGNHIHNARYHYHLVEYERDGQKYIDVVPREEDYYGEHDMAESLAHLISKLIKEGDYVVLTFTGEDGEKWGYYIDSEEVKSGEYLFLVDGVPADIYARNKKKEEER